MTHRLVSLIVMPSGHEDGWRAALRRAATLADWDYLDYWGVNDRPVDLGRHTLIFTGDEATLAGLVPTDVVVLTASPEDVLARSKFLYGEDDVIALGHAASRLGAASFLVDQGAVLHHVLDKTIEVPGLGTIARDDSQDRQVMPEAQPDAVSTLQIFNQIPPPVGVSAFWPASIFRRFDDETAGAAAETIDLTGRGRILIHGPYLAIPAGRWRVTFNFEFEIPVGSVPFRFEWGEIADVVAHDVRVRESGRYSISLERDWVEAGRAEVRIWLYHAVFQGDFRLIGCMVERVPAVDEGLSVGTGLSL